jgi:hypothetical protein
MAHVRYSLGQRVFIFDCYVTTTSYRLCRRNFAISAYRIIGLISYKGTLDAQILDQFFVLSHAEERFGYFMQDSASPHTSKETILAL